MTNTGGLQQAIENNNLKRIQALVEQGVPLNSNLKGGHPPLFVAAIGGNARMIKLLVHAGANPRQRGAFRETALHFARTPAAADALIAAGADVEAQSLHGTPLFAAVAGGLPAVVSKLLDAGADPDARAPERGDTPLHAAIRCSSTKIVQLLLEQGADPDVRNNDGFTPLDLAALMREKRAASLVKALIEGGATVDLADKRGHTALMHAASNGSVESIRCLIEAGANVNAATKWKENALSQAVVIGRRDVAAVLIDAGADPDIRISKSHPNRHLQGRTARELAAAGSDRRLRSLLD